MAITETYNSMKTNLRNAYNSLSTKGATIPSKKNLVNLKTTIDSIKTGGGDTDLVITNCSYLFYGGARLSQKSEILKLCKDITSTAYMFNYCTSFSLDVSDIDTSKVTTMSYMFANCSNLTDLDISNFNTSSLTNASYMFSSCSKLANLDLGNFNTTNVTNLDNMFNGCSKLTSLDLSNWSNPKLTTMNYFVSSCPALTDLNLTNFMIPSVKYMRYTFYNCSKLTNLDLSSFDASKVADLSYLFSSCKSLTNLTFMNNLGKGFTQKTNNYSSYKLDLSACTNLTTESLLDIIDKLYDLKLTYNVENGGTLYTQQLIIGQTNIAKLTSERIAWATHKGWVVS